EPPEEPARPDDVVGRQRAQQLLVAGVIVEAHPAVLDTEDKALALEILDVVARADRPSRLSEGAADVLYDVPALLLLPDLVDAVVARCEVPVVEEQVHGDETVQLTRA